MASGTALFAVAPGAIAPGIAVRRTGDSFVPGFRFGILGFRPARGQVMSSGQQVGGPEGRDQRSRKARKAERRADRTDGQGFEREKTAKGRVSDRQD